ncbi:acyltransferase family protein [Yoonia sp.]|uniref:acyltransferase family protein n=1 Tax=Yoonia sp. TaxID=2212373 RepID=UPI003976F104
MINLAGTSSNAARTGALIPYVSCLDGVRAASILLVLLAHTAPLGPKPWLLNAMAARMGMALFFCLSGYLIVSMLYRKPDVLPFITKRIMRIVPALFLYLTVLLVFFDLPIQSYILNLMFVSNYAVSGLSDGPVSHIWSLCVEMHFYLAIGLAVLLGGARAVWLVVPGALIITGFRVEAGVISNINTHLRADEILVGGWLALVSYYWGAHLRAFFAHRAIAGALIALLSGLFMASSHDYGGVLVYLRPYIAMALVGVIMHCQLRPLLDVLESRIARYIARISYALYIWHPLMVFGMMNTGSTMERYLFKRPISWALTWIAAHLSTKYWEAFWQRRVRQWLQKRCGTG